MEFQFRPVTSILVTGRTASVQFVADVTPCCYSSVTELKVAACNDVLQDNYALLCGLGLLGIIIMAMRRKVRAPSRPCAYTSVHPDVRAPKRPRRDVLHRNDFQNRFIMNHFKWTVKISKLAPAASLKSIMLILDYDVMNVSESDSLPNHTPPRYRKSIRWSTS